MKERRKVNRRPLDFEVTCYIDGARLEAHALDISVGGVFVGTDMARPVPIGALAGLVFVSESVGVSTTFLFGRVVRKQDVPVRGFAVEWEKAVSAGAPDELKVFLDQLLGLANPMIELESVSGSGAGSGLTRSVYRFPVREGARSDSSGTGTSRAFEDESFVDIPFLYDSDDAVTAQDNDESDAGIEIDQPAVHSMAVSAPHESSDSDKVFDDLQFCFENLDVSDEEISLVTITTGVPVGHSAESETVVDAHITATGHGRAGQVSSVVEKSDTVMPCSVNGVLVMRGVHLPVVITQIGLTAATVSSPFVPVDDTEKLELSFFIGTKRGEAPLKCHGRMTSVVTGKEPGFKMAFSRLDEGASPGILRRYLKWLHFNNVAGS